MRHPSADRWREKRRSQGGCLECASPAISGEQHCMVHKEKKRQTGIKARERKKASGTCLRCLKSVVPGLTHCEKHRLASNKRQYDRQGVKAHFMQARHFAIRRLKKRVVTPWALTLDEFASFFGQLCHYCHLEFSSIRGSGLDRLDNDRGYEVGNVVPCCTVCNLIRGNRFSVQEMETFGGPAIRSMMSGIKLSRQASKDSLDERAEWTMAQEMAFGTHGSKGWEK